MKITLFLEDRLVNFTLPNQVSGSYRFDVLKDEVDKLINIEAKDNKWVLYSTDLVSVLFNNQIVPYVEIVPNNFYIISRNKINYLIYVNAFFKQV